MSAPRITPEDVEANIVSEHCFTAADGVVGAFVGAQVAQGRGVYADEIATVWPPLKLLTLCILGLRNGFTVVGKSACASPENFNADKGRELARADAIRQVWPLMGYELRSRIAEGHTTIADRTPAAPAATPLLSFGDALSLLKAGAKVARLGWNGKGMWLSLSGPLKGREVPAHAFWSDNNRAYAEGLENKTATVLPSITMKTATGEVLMGWLASQSDMLAEDWVLVP